MKWSIFLLFWTGITRQHIGALETATVVDEIASGNYVGDFRSHLIKRQLPEYVTGDESTNCSDVKFIQVPVVGDKGLVVHVSKEQVAMTWGEAVCCCRSLGLYLASPLNREEMDKLLAVVIQTGVHEQDQRKWAWTDIHGYYGTWNSLRTGNRISPSRDLFVGWTDVPEQLGAAKGVCLYLSQYLENEPFYFLENYFNSSLCHSRYVLEGILLCEDKKGDSFGISVKGDFEKDCTEKKVLRYIEEKMDRTVISRDSINTTETDEAEKCPRNCHQKGWCTDYQRCVEIDGDWEWEPESEAFVGEWKSFTCPGNLIWNPESPAGRNGSCDFFENLTVERRREYKRNPKCWAPCHYEEHDDMEERCSGKFWLNDRTNSSVRHLDIHKLLQCPAGLIFNKMLNTCTKCQDITGQTKTECCGTSPKSNHSKRKFKGLNNATQQRQQQRRNNNATGNGKNKPLLKIGFFDDE